MFHFMYIRYNKNLNCQKGFRFRYQTVYDAMHSTTAAIQFHSDDPFESLELCKFTITLFAPPTNFALIRLQIFALK